MSLKIENSVLMAAESEELDYEGDDANSPIKKRALEKEEDLEEGEISDTNDEDSPKKRVCYFFQRGECRLGDKCTGLHVTECLYKMIDSPPAIPSVFQNACHGANNSNLLYSVINPCTLRNVCSTANLQANTSSLGNFEQCETALTAWDRALIEAKKLVKNFDKQTNRTCPPVTITIESDDERLSCKSTKKPRRYRSSSPKMLSRDSSLTDDVKKLPKQKSVDSKRDWHRANKWHDPWRRSPVHPTKSFPNSANSVRNSRSPQRRKPDYLSISEKRLSKIVGNRNKSISRRSLSSSSSLSIHRPRKESLKPIQKENVSPSIEVTELKPSISKQEPPEIAKKTHKTNIHRSSSSSSRASIHRSIKENLKVIQEKKAAVVNKPDRNLKLPISDRRPRKIAENWHRTVSRRSSSSSSRTSIHRSIKDNLKTIQEKKSSAVGNKRDKNVKLFDRRPHKIAENGHKVTSHRSSTSSSPPSVYRSREIWSKRNTKPQTSKQQKKISPAVLERNSKSTERFKEKFPSSSFTSNCRSNDVGRWTPKKVRPPTPTVKSCSDMSISPLTDSSLSDIFDPDKKENKDRTYRHEASRSRRSLCQAEVYGPICPPKNQIVAPSMSETKSKVIQNNKFAIENLSGTTRVVANSPACATKNKTVNVSKSKQGKNRKFSRNLEADLFKFHRQPIFPADVQQESTEQPEPILPNDVQQKSSETEVNKTQNKNDQSQKMPETQNNQMKETSLTRRLPCTRKQSEPILPNGVKQKSTETEVNKTPKTNVQSQKMPETQNHQMKKQTFLTRRLPRTRKEEILQQLEAINAAIERKKTTMYVLRK